MLGGVLLQSGATALVALSSSIYIAAPAMALASAAWLTTANTLSVSAQVALPDWVQARGMSIFQMAIMGASAAGAGAQASRSRGFFGVALRFRATRCGTRQPVPAPICRARCT